MEFLNPQAIAIAAGLTIPPLIALYFLKLKRTVHSVPSTLLWKRAVEDLHANAPFQRLRSSLLLLLQLAILVAAAVALGQPMFHAIQRYEENVIILIDQSASMNVVESDGKTRLEMARQEAHHVVDNLAPDARAMVIAFCDRATVVSSFDTDRDALHRQIDSVEPTDSRTALAEAISLAEAYTQNVIIGTEEAGGEIAPESAAAGATVFVFTDGRIEDAAQVALQRFDVDRIQVIRIGERSDNAGITSMQARRLYEQPDILQVTATIRNVSGSETAADAVLYVNGKNMDVQPVTLGPATTHGRPPSGARGGKAAVRVVTFDDVEFEGAGRVEVVLQLDDALAADNRAWTVIDAPKRVSALLVGPLDESHRPLHDALAAMKVDLTLMAPEDYESAAERNIAEGGRSRFDVVVLDRHSTSRLPNGNYMFWGGIPLVDGVAATGTDRDGVIFNWDDTHPILRHVAVETIRVAEWLHLELPPEAVPLIEGERSPILAYLARGPNQYLICAYSLIAEDDVGRKFYNTNLSMSTDFVLLVYNAVQFLSSNIATRGRRSVHPGETVTLPVRAGTREVQIVGPDGRRESHAVGAGLRVHFAHTRQVGLYRVEPTAEGEDQFAVNLFNANETDITPAGGLTLGADRLAAEAAVIDTNQPAWQYVLLGLLLLLLLEWIIYNRRVFV